MDMGLYVGLIGKCFCSSANNRGFRAEEKTHASENSSKGKGG
jgi:hypothetical protein